MSIKEFNIHGVWLTRNQIENEIATGDLKPLGTLAGMKSYGLCYTCHQHIILLDDKQTLMRVETNNIGKYIVIGGRKYYLDGIKYEV